MKNIKLFFIIIILVGAGLFFGFLWGSSGSLAGQSATNIEERSPSMMIDFGDGVVSTFSNLSLGEGENVFNLLQRVAQDNNVSFEYEEYSGLGVLITQIDGRSGGDGKKYWQYWVNNISPDIGAIQYVVQPGDVIEWKFIKYQSNEE